MRQHRSRGSVVSTFGLLIPVLMGFVSMGVDWGRVSVARLAVRVAADEAALSAASALTERPKSAQAIAAAYAVATSRASLYAGQMELNQLDFSVDTLTLGYYDADAGGWSNTVPNGKAPNAVHAVVSAEVELTFAKLFGLDKVKVSQSAKAGAAVIPGRAPDLVIVQDVTPSMSSTDIANSKIANKALVSCIEENAHPSTRGAFVKFANIDKTVVPLQSYQEAPGELYDAVAAASPTNAYSYSGICTATNGCTSHASGLYAAVDILNQASEPPEDVGQAIIIITDGAPATTDTGCSSVASSSGMSTPFQKWLVGNYASRCGLLSAQNTQTACNNAGGRWFTSGTKCRPSDNGAESGTGAAGPGKCSKSGYSNEFRCEGAGGQWRRSSGSTLNPSSLTRWTDEAKALAQNGTWGPIDVYAIYYSSGATNTYQNDALAFLRNHVVNGAGAELGPLNAPSGSALVEALEAVCKEYTVGRPGLIE